jgi:hypothetical protein
MSINKRRRTTKAPVEDELDGDTVNESFNSSKSSAKSVAKLKRGRKPKKMTKIVRKRKETNNNAKKAVDVKEILGNFQFS